MTSHNPHQLRLQTSLLPSIPNAAKCGINIFLDQAQHCLTPLAINIRNAKKSVLQLTTKLEHVKVTSFTVTSHTTSTKVSCPEVDEITKQLAVAQHNASIKQLQVDINT